MLQCTIFIVIGIVISTCITFIYSALPATPILMYSPLFHIGIGYLV